MKESFIVAYGYDKEGDKPIPIMGRVKGNVSMFDEETKFRYIQISAEALALIVYNQETKQ